MNVTPVSRHQMNAKLAKFNSQTTSAASATYTTTKATLNRFITVINAESAELATALSITIVMAVEHALMQ
jgi:hypothetical protein